MLMLFDNKAEEQAFYAFSVTCTPLILVKTNIYLFSHLWFFVEVMVISVEFSLFYETLVLRRHICKKKTAFINNHFCIPAAKEVNFLRTLSCQKR